MNLGWAHWRMGSFAEAIRSRGEARDLARAPPLQGAGARSLRCLGVAVSAQDAADRKSLLESLRGSARLAEKAELGAGACPLSPVPSEWLHGWSPRQACDTSTSEPHLWPAPAICLLEATSGSSLLEITAARGGRCH